MNKLKALFNSGSKNKAARLTTATVAAGLAVAATPEMASAFAAPVVGDFGYDMYDMAVNKILKGPIGFIVGLGLIVWSATQIQKNYWIAIMGVIGGSAVVKADTIVTSMGFIL